MEFFTRELTQKEREDFYNQIGSDCIIFEGKKLCPVHVFLTYIKLDIDISGYVDDYNFATLILPWIHAIKIVVTPHRIEWRCGDVVLHHL